MPTLGGAMFVHNGIQFDYPFREVALNLCDFCDQVCVVDAGSTDGTTQQLIDLNHPKLTVICRPHAEWQAQQGYNKLAYFSNIAISHLPTDYIFYLQADELLLESSYEWVRVAMGTGKEAFWVTRTNLWGSPKKYFDMPHNNPRKVCASEVIRLGQADYRAEGTAECIWSPVNRDQGAVWDYYRDIEIVHVGFLRDKVKHVDKLRHQQEQIHGIPLDERVEGKKEFDGSGWFCPDELRDFTKPLPEIIRPWIESRCGDDD